MPCHERTCGRGSDLDLPASLGRLLQLSLEPLGQPLAPRAAAHHQQPVQQRRLPLQVASTHHLQLHTYIYVYAHSSNLIRIVYVDTHPSHQVRQPEPEGRGSGRTRALGVQLAQQTHRRRSRIHALHPQTDNMSGREMVTYATLTLLCATLTWACSWRRGAGSSSSSGMTNLSPPTCDARDGRNLSELPCFHHQCDHLQHSAVRELVVHGGQREEAAGPVLRHRTVRHATHTLLQLTGHLQLRGESG